MIYYVNLRLFFLQHSETFDVSHVFLPLIVAELSTLKQVRFFGPPCISDPYYQITCCVCLLRLFCCFAFFFLFLLLPVLLHTSVCDVFNKLNCLLTSLLTYYLSTPCTYCNRNPLVYFFDQPVC